MIFLLLLPRATGIPVEDTPILICDTSEDASVEAMAAQATVVLNCVGPYRFHGEQVVKACVKMATNHVDISGNSYGYL